MEKKSKFPYYLSIFLISPALAFFYGIANFKDKAARIILFFFFGAYGYTMIRLPGKDSHTLSLDFASFYQNLSFDEFINQIWVMLALEKSGSTVDEPYIHVLSYLLAQFTNNADWLFLVAGVVFGFFYIKGVYLVYSEIDSVWNISLIFLFIFFVSWISLTGLNAPRNWTAAYCFFFGAVLYLKTFNRKYLLIVLLAPFIHFAYLVITVPFFIYVFFKDLKYIYLVILIVSFVASASRSFIKPYLESTELGQDKTRAYVEADRWSEDAQQAADNRNFHAKFYRVSSDISIQFLFITAILFFGYFSGRNHDDFLTGLASTSILMLSFSNFFASIPVLSERIFVNYGNFALAYLVLLFSKNFVALKSKQWLINLCIPAILLFLFTQYSQFGDFMDFRVLFSPIFYPFLGDDPISMKAFLRQLLGV